MSGSELTPCERQLYGRQLITSGWGAKGQLRLKRAKVVVAGVGGLGCLASIYLAAAGVGHLCLIDDDVVELSDMNRQVLYWRSDVGKHKVESAVKKLRQINPEIRIDGVVRRIGEQTIHDLLKEANVVVDGLDNFKTRFVVNKACVESKTPFVHGGVYGFEGVLMTVVPFKGPCLRCLYTIDPVERQLFPVVGATPGTIACLQTIEAIKIITGIGEPCVGHLLTFDGEMMKFTQISVTRDPKCPVCSAHEKTSASSLSSSL